MHAGWGVGQAKAGMYASLCSCVQQHGHTPACIRKFAHARTHANMLTSVLPYVYILACSGGVSVGNLGKTLDREEYSRWASSCEPAYADVSGSLYSVQYACS